MPIIGATQIQPVNFLESYARGRQLGEVERALQQQEVDRIRNVEQQRLLNQLYSQSMTPTGTLDMNALGRQMITAGMGAQVPALQAQQAEIGLKTAQARKAESEVRPAEWKQLREELAALPDNDQARYQSWAAGLLRRAPWAIDFLAPTLTAESKRQMLMTADAALPKLEFRDLGGGTAGFDPYTAKQVGPVTMNVPDSPAVAAQKLARASASASRIDLGKGESAFVTGLGKTGSEELAQSRTSATGARESISNIQSLSSLVNSPDFISGAFGDAKLFVAKTLGLRGVPETEAFFSQMGRDVAEIIKSFGAGTGLSDADRAFAEKISGGKITLDKNSIRKILWLNANYNNERIRKYNERISEILANKATSQETKDMLSMLHSPIATVNPGPRPVSSLDEARLLPEGTEVVMPDGAVLAVPKRKRN